jgi:ribosome-binding ATPase YchF (GTP1/OBG family)
LEKAVARLEKESRIKKESRPAFENAVAAQKVLEAGETLFAAGEKAGVDLDLAAGLGLLTTKPFIYVFNLDEDQLADADLHASLASSSRRPTRCSSTPSSRWTSWRCPRRTPSRCSSPSGRRSPGLDQLARVGFHTLGLQTYLTAGPKESRAWTIRQGWTAPQAAGVIHTDFQRGFIKAEIVSFADLDAAGSMAAARAAGRVRMEGKEYVMADGDVVEFRFNV